MAVISRADSYLCRLQLFVDKEENALICGHVDCGFALSVERSQLTSHLRDKHQVDDDTRRALIRCLASEYPRGFTNPVKIPQRVNGCEIQPHLQRHDGFACGRCSYFTTSFQSLGRHVSQTHFDRRPATRKSLDGNFNHVTLQAWT